MNTLPESGFLRLRQIIGDHRRGYPPIIPVSASTWWAGVRSGRFPSPIHLGQRLALWRVEDIHALVARLAQGISQAYAETTKPAQASRWQRKCIHCR